MESLITWCSILQPHQNSLILHAFMDLFCSFIRVNLFSEKVGGLCILCSSISSFSFVHSFYLRTYVHLCILLIWLTTLNFNALYRYRGKWCCKCITFCIPCQEMKRTLIPIISMEYIDWFSYLCLSYKRAIYWENWGWCFSCVFSVSLG
jgi:hypothetical protein